MVTLVGNLNIEGNSIVIFFLWAKFYIFRFKLDKINPSIEVYMAKVRAMCNLELFIASNNGTVSNHYVKWKSYFYTFLNLFSTICMSP